MTCGHDEMMVVDDYARCLDCGVEFTRAPDGAYVRSIVTWWLNTFFVSVIVVLGPVLAADFALDGDPALSLLVVLGCLLYVVTFGQRLRAAAVHLAG